MKKVKAKIPTNKAVVLLLFALIIVLTACENKSEITETRKTNRVNFQQKQPDLTIVALGDSLTAGMGVVENKAYPAILENKLKADGYNCRVVNAGISGETSSGTLSRINWVISALKPDIVILVIGANDGMRGIDPGFLKDNLDKLVSKLREKKIKVILGGMKMLPNLGPDYIRTFEKAYPEIAEKHGITFIPFFLKDVAGVSKYNQPDGIHPTTQGYKVIVDNIYPYILKAVKEEL